MRAVVRAVARTVAMALTDTASPAAASWGGCSGNGGGHAG